MGFRLRQKSEGIAAQIDALILKAERIADQVVYGGHARRKSGSGETFWQFREYTQDDDARHIDWRQSAKSDRIFIKQKEEEKAQKALFWSCGAESMRYQRDGTMDKAEAAQTLALALGVLTVRGGDQVGEFERGRAGHSETALHQLAESLVREREATLPEVTSALPRNAHVFLCGDFLAPLDEIEAVFERIEAKTRKGVVVQVLDPVEIEFPFSGRVEFQDLAVDETVQIDHAVSVRDVYMERFEAHCRGLKTLCARLGWHYLLHRTDKPLVDSVRDIVERS